MERKLSAIMFTDIVGFTSHMAQDEEKTLAIINKMRDIMKPIVEEHHGLWIKEMGDGTITSYQSATNAIDAAIKIQITLRKVKEFQIRIGLHLGEIVHENNDVLGEGVNIAARIEPLAETGGIYFSNAIYDSIRNKPKYTVEYVGSKTLKNVGRDIEIYAIQNEGFPKIKRNEDLKKEESSKAAEIVEEPKIVEEAKARHVAVDKEESGGMNKAILAIAVIVIIATSYFGYMSMASSSVEIPSFVTENKTEFTNFAGGVQIDQVEQKLKRFQRDGKLRLSSKPMKQKDDKFYMIFVIRGNFISKIYYKDGDQYINFMKQDDIQTNLNVAKAFYIECDK